MKTYRNMIYHKELNRHVAAQLIQEFDQKIEYKRDIEARGQEDQTNGLSTNVPELRLREILLKRVEKTFDA